ncbi:unnamed protein product [Penicillium salamii]|nr:unnamed protein product [Penicillium salamii]CAG8240595.1 unnamed protein product [Penicillium salamii]CAG8403012.1 unnamed protein product [Penicillium salamii]
MSSGHSDHADDTATAPQLPQSAPMSETAHQSSIGAMPLVSTKEKDNTRKIEKQSLEYALRSGIAGGLAGCAAKTVVAPLDRVKILFQASNPQFAKYTGSWSGLAHAIRDINRHEGARGLYKGHSVTLLRIFPYAAIKFLAYEQIRAVLIPSSEHETPLRRLISGSLAGVTSVCFTYPLELMRVRMAFETSHSHRSGLLDIMRQIYHERAAPTPRSAAATESSTVAAVEGAASTVNKIAPRTGLINFYRGFAPTILGMLPYAGISFLTHDTVGDFFRHPSLAPYTLKRAVDGDIDPRKAELNKNRPLLNAPFELLAGALAGLASQTSSYPIEVIRRRMQVGGAVGDGHRLGIAETGRKIWLECGFRGFWVGLTIGYIKVVPMYAVAFFVYERVKGSLRIG